MKVTIEELTRGYVVTRMRPNGPLAGLDECHAKPCASSALHLAAAWLGVEPATLYAPEIALRETGSATGGGMATHHVEPGPDLTPEVEALIERGDEEAPLSGLKAGEAYRDEEE